MAAYYNEMDKKAAAGLRALIEDGFIAPGDVDERSIAEVQPDDLKGYTQCHFFAGIGGWSVALRLAGWSDDRPVWTGSCPCQPFSSAGKRKGHADDRHLWPVWFRLIRECRPARIYGEQVASAIAHGWLDEVAAGLEAEGYAIGAAVLPACAAGGFHRRDRLWFVAHAGHQRSTGKEQQADRSEQYRKRTVVDASCERSSGASGQCIQEVGRQESDNSMQSQRAGNSIVDNPECAGLEGYAGNVEGCGGGQSEDGSAAETNSSAENNALLRLRGNIGDNGFIDSMHPLRENRGWPSNLQWIECPDGKTRPVKPGICLLAHGIPERVHLLRAAGNAIYPPTAAEFIKAAEGAIA